MRYLFVCFLLCLLSSSVFGEPALADKGYAKIVTNENFKDLILEAAKDVLIEFYAPWCGHCKNLAPAYEKLAQKLASEDVIIAKFDAQAHQVPSLFDVRGYPSLYWLPKNSKDAPIIYKGGRDLKDFVKFIAQHSSDGLKAYGRDGKKVSQKVAESKTEEHADVQKKEADVEKPEQADVEIEKPEQVDVEIEKPEQADVEIEKPEQADVVEIETQLPKEEEFAKEAVTANFNELVMEADKDVLIEFYAPWCGHCKTFSPTFETLAKDLTDEDVLFVKMDATVEMQSLVEIESVPTLYWLPKNAKDAPVAYDGGRNLTDLIKFVAEHSTDGLKAYGRDGEKKDVQSIEDLIPAIFEEELALEQPAVSEEL